MPITRQGDGCGGHPAGYRGDILAEQEIIDVTEQKRLNDAREAGIPWKKWRPYLSERQWGTVREDCGIPPRQLRPGCKSLAKARNPFFRQQGRTGSKRAQFEALAEATIRSVTTGILGASP